MGLRRPPRRLSCCWLLFIYVQEPIPSNLTYVIIATTFFGPLAFGWRPFLAASVVILVAVATAMGKVNLEGAVDWGIGILAALAVERRAPVDEAAAARVNWRTPSGATPCCPHRRAHRPAEQAGLEQRLPTLWADAERRGEPIRVCFLDVRGLKRANDVHGHDFGDLVITDVADAITATVRAGDLVARWGGDEFVHRGGRLRTPTSTRLR